MKMNQKANASRGSFALPCPRKITITKELIEESRLPKCELKGCDKEVFAGFEVRGVLYRCCSFEHSVELAWQLGIDISAEFGGAGESVGTEGK
jgi:hypothetical protein